MTSAAWCASLLHKFKRPPTGAQKPRGVLRICRRELCSAVLGRAGHTSSTQALPVSPSACWGAPMQHAVCLHFGDEADAEIERSAAKLNYPPENYVKNVAFINLRSGLRRPICCGCRSA